MSRVLVTGGAGRLGLTVCRALSQNGFEVRIFDLANDRNRKSVRKLPQKVQVRWGSITDPESLRKAIKDIDAVVHMAGILPPVADEKPDLAKEVNVDGTRLLIELLRQEGRRIPLIFTSSVSVFGPNADPSKPVNAHECEPCPVDVYARTKIEAENLIRESGLDYLILRLTAVMYFSFDLSDVKRMFSVPLDTRVEFCHPDDLAMAIVNAISRFEEIKGKPLIVSSGPGERMLYGDMVGSMLGVMGLPMPPADKFAQEPYYLDWYDTTESQQLLNFQKKTFTDYLDDYRGGLTRRYSALFLPFMRYFVAPVFGKAIARFM